MAFSLRFRGTERPPGCKCYLLDLVDIKKPLLSGLLDSKCPVHSEEVERIYARYSDIQASKAKPAEA